jgi:hypothetical protein
MLATFALAALATATCAASTAAVPSFAALLVCRDAHGQAAVASRRAERRATV